MRSNLQGWIGVDLDGTLAVYDGWKGIEHIGEPVERMVLRVRAYLDQGIPVRIFTARANTPEAVPFIKDWCFTHIGSMLEVTSQKDFAMIRLYDDRAVQVEHNTGRIIG